MHLLLTNILMKTLKLKKDMALLTIRLVDEKKIKKDQRIKIKLVINDIHFFYAIIMEQ